MSSPISEGTPVGYFNSPIISNAMLIALWNALPYYGVFFGIDSYGNIKYPSSFQTWFAGSSAANMRFNIRLMFDSPVDTVYISYPNVSPIVAVLDYPVIVFGITIYTTYGL